MRKYVRVMNGLTSNADGFEYKLNDVNETTNWHPQEKEPDQMGGFNFSTEDKILRWIHRGDTLYDVIIPQDAEVILCDEEKGIYRTNKIIITNPQKLTDELIIELYHKNTLSNKVLAQCLQILLWKDKMNISKYIIKDYVNKDNIKEITTEFVRYAKDNKYNKGKLSNDSKIIYDILMSIEEE